jgi:hypothetical protein
MTPPDPRHAGLVRALEEFEQILASWHHEDPDDLDQLPIYDKGDP